jgi:hypothetical protein
MRQMGALRPEETFAAEEANATEDKGAHALPYSFV